MASTNPYYEDWKKNATFSRQFAQVDYSQNIIYSNKTRMRNSKETKKSFILARNKIGLLSSNNWKKKE